LVYTWVGVPALITLAFWVYTALYGSPNIVLFGKANIVPDEEHPGIFTLNENHTVTFENGTNTNEPFIIKRGVIVEEEDYSDENHTEKEPRGLMMQIMDHNNTNENEIALLVEAWSEVAPALTSIAKEDRTEDGRHLCEAVEHVEPTNY